MRAIRDYDIVDQIYEGQTSLVLRARRHADGRPVVLKVLKGPRPSARELARYQHEFALLSSLHLASVIEVVAPYEPAMM